VFPEETVKSRRQYLKQTLAVLRRPAVERALILLKAAMVIAVFLWPVWWVHVHVMSRHVSQTPLSLAVSLLGVQAATILAELMASSVVKKLDSMSARRSARRRPVIRVHLSAHLAGHNRFRELRRHRVYRPRDLEGCVIEMLTAAGGAAHEGLSDLAVELGLVRRWQRYAYRGRREHKAAVEYLGLLAPRVARPALLPLLNSPAPWLQATAYRVLARCSEEKDLTPLFRTALNAPLFVRVLVAGDLRNHAGHLAAHALPSVLASGAPEEVAAALAMVEAWGRALPVPQLTHLMRHPNAAVRARALRLAPLHPELYGLEELILGALEDPDAQVRLAALYSTERLRLKNAVPLLRQYTNSPDDELSRLAFRALAMVGPQGRIILENEILTGESRTASRAAESLAEAKMRWALEPQAV
jgi:HEAT repeat protein